MHKEIFPDNVPLSENLESIDVWRASTARPVYLAQNLPDIFELVRQYAGNTPITVNSAHRKHIPLGGVKNSMHLTGDALDLGLSSVQMLEFLDNFNYFIHAAMAYGITGVGIYDWGVHVDVNSKDVNSWWLARDGVQHYVRFWNKSRYPSPMVLNSGSGVDGSDEIEADTGGGKDFAFAFLALFALYFLTKLNR